MIYPAFGVVYATGLDAFSSLDPHERRRNGDRTALYFFVIAIISTTTIGLQNYMFASAAAKLSAKLRSLSFRAILRQDSAFLPLIRIISFSSFPVSLQLNFLIRTRIAVVA